MVPAKGGDETMQALSDAREAQASLQTEAAKLRAELVALRARLVERERSDTELRRDYAKLAQQMNRVVKLGQSTFEEAPVRAAAPVAYQALPAPTERDADSAP
jgi:hypothetical protein